MTEFDLDSELPLEAEMREEAAEARRLASVVAAAEKGYYRRCFSSADGRKVLAHMLYTMSYFSQDGPVELKNYAAKLMSNLGFTDKYERIEFFIDKCFEIEQTERKPDV